MSHISGPGAPLGEWKIGDWFHPAGYLRILAAAGQLPPHLTDGGGVHSNLKCYLTDHLAGAAIVIRILTSLQSVYAATEVGAFARGLLREVTADEQTLLARKQLIAGNAGDWKRSVARVFSSL